jgi:hypothetical protein
MNIKEKLSVKNYKKKHFNMKEKKYPMKIRWNKWKNNYLLIKKFKKVNHKF